jgi:hypothetical protein
MDASLRWRDEKASADMISLSPLPGSLQPQHPARQVGRHHRRAGGVALELGSVREDPAQAFGAAVERPGRVAARAKRVPADDEAGALPAARSPGPAPLGRDDRRDPPGPGRIQPVQAGISGAWVRGPRSKRSAFITLVQAATKSLTNFSPASAPA